MAILTALLLAGCGNPEADRELLRARSIDRASDAIANGANVNARDQAGMTALNNAARKGDERSRKLAQFLIAYGAEYTVWDAVALGDLKAVEKHLESGGDVSATLTDGTTLLHAAVGSGQEDVVIYLLSKGAEINKRGGWGKTVLDRAMEPENRQMVELLKKNGAKTGEELGAGLLHQAVKERDLDLAKKLIEGGTDIEERGDRNATPLYFAAYYVDPAMTRLLLEKGADVHARDYSGEIPLHTAVYHSYPAVQDKGVKVIQLLLDYGSDVNATATLGLPFKRRPLDFSVGNYRKEKIAALLRKHGARTGGR